MRNPLCSGLLFFSMAFLFVLTAIACKKEESIEPTLELNITSLNMAPEGNSTASFSISSNTSWTVESSENWLTLDPTAGSKNGTITLSAHENKSITERTASITIYADALGPQTIAVTQSAAGPSLSVSTNELSLDGAANSSETFNITSNTSWTASASEDWVTLDPVSGTENATVKVTALENPNEAERTATISIEAEGASPKTVSITQNGTPCSYASQGYCDDSGCPVPGMPAPSALSANEFLPNPFTFQNGESVSSREDWTCRRTEIAAFAQEYEYGYIPCTPKSATTATFNESENTLTVTITDNGKTISFTSTITYPSTGTAPYPAMIGIGGSWLNNEQLSNLGVAVISFPNNEIAEQENAGSRGKGKFYDLYCSDHPAGALAAWSWGVSRLIDALEKTPEANINPNRLAVTGCSRNGKGALAAGAFEERIVLTIPQESGSGGSASWRVSDAQKAAGQNVQTLSQIVGENTWFKDEFSQFSNSAEKLPYDHHMIEGLVAPRALLVIENTSMEWLGNESAWATGKAAHKIWEALGVPDRMGMSQVGHGQHCLLPVSQQPAVEAYVRKFLLGDESANTTIMESDGNFTFDEERWINWEVPSLQ